MKRVSNLYHKVYDIDNINKMCDLVCSKVKNKDKAEIENIINEIYKEICNELLLDNEELQRYIKKNLSSFVEIIKNAVKQNTLDKVFITQKFII